MAVTTGSRKVLAFSTLLLVGALAIGFGVFRWLSIERTFRCQTEGRASLSNASGSFVDVVLIERLPNDKSRARILVENVLLIEYRDVSDLEDEVTMRLSVEQAFILEDAQLCGKLQCNLRRQIEEPILDRTMIWLGLREPNKAVNKLTVREILEGTATESP